MQRGGFIKSEIVFVVVILAALCGLAVLFTFRNATADDTYRPDDFKVYKDEQVVRAQDMITQPPRGHDIPKDDQKEVTHESGLKYTEIRVGDGEKVKIGSLVLVSYKGSFPNGEVFDSTGNKAPLPVTIGKGDVIKGWEIGLLGMRAGGKRKIKVPYQLAYGEAGKPPKIPGKADLHFELEVMRVNNDK